MRLIFVLVIDCSVKQCFKELICYLIDWKLHQDSNWFTLKCFHHFLLTKYQIMTDSHEPKQFLYDVIFYQLNRNELTNFMTKFSAG